MKNVLIRVIELEVCHREDAGVAGRYRVALHEDAEPALAAAQALDVFHSNVPIKHLESFAFYLEDTESGESLYEPDEYRTRVPTLALWNGWANEAQVSL